PDGTSFQLGAMMNQNMETRARCYWHVAEWLRQRFNVPLQVNHREGTRDFQFRLPPYPRATASGLSTFVTCPMSVQMDLQQGTRGNCDVRLFRLGQDFYGAERLPRTLHNFVPAGTPTAVDGLIVVTVKMQFTFHTQTFATISAQLAQLP